MKPLLYFWVSAGEVSLFSPALFPHHVMHIQQGLAAKSEIL